MGICSSYNSLPQLLVLGLDGAGKTTFLYADKWDSFEPTYGFNYEEIRLRGIVKVAVWDVGGKSTLKCLWPTLYKNIHFAAVVFVIDADKPDRFLEVRKELHILTNEEELREAAFLVIFNSRRPELQNLQELNSRVGLDLLHSLLKIKAFLIDLMQENEVFNEAILWVSEHIAK
jgi:GTPase SAR1 family protein